MSMSRILQEMNDARRASEVALSKDNFYTEKKGDLTIVMLKTSEEEEKERLIAERTLREPTIKFTEYKRDEEEFKPVKLTKKGLVDKRYGKRCQK